MAGAVVTAMVLTVLHPASIRPGPSWLLLVLEGALLVALVAVNPGKITRASSVLRVLSIGLVAVLGISSMASTMLLIEELIEGGSVTNEARPLLEAGVKVWAGNGLAFALLFWELDGGGPAQRAVSMPRYLDFAFPQQASPNAPPNWRPRLLDYLYLSYTNSIAFSPTDVMPFAPWAKIAMTLQSLVSFAIVGLVIARAVNVFQ